MLVPDRVTTKLLDCKKVEIPSGSLMSFSEGLLCGGKQPVMLSTLQKGLNLL